MIDILTFTITNITKHMYPSIFSDIKSTLTSSSFVHTFTNKNDCSHPRFWVPQ